MHLKSMKIINGITWDFGNLESNNQNSQWYLLLTFFKEESVQIDMPKKNVRNKLTQTQNQ